MRVIVCGGRDFHDYPTVDEALDRYGVTMIAHGGAPGADACAQTYAELAGVPVREFPARWIEHGKAAGPIRNQEMLDKFKPDAVIAFPGGRGTADMVRRAKAAGVRVIEVDTPTPHAGGTDA